VARFGRLERAIAMGLGRFPRVKGAVKEIYGRLQFLRYRKNYSFRSDYSVMPITEKGSSFFGYYDKDPMNWSGQVLCHLTSGDTARPPAAGTAIRVAVFGPGTGTTPIIEVETKAFNWQQGARAHWLDNEHFVFNDFDLVNKIYCARVFSAANGLEQARYARPVQDSFREKCFLSINY
jgi:hypothetical protein